MHTYTPDKIRNIALVGHGGVGKTMLAEHMLYLSGGADRVGTIEAGSTHSDFDPLEKARKISINAAVLPIEWNDHKINIIDVPGYADFVADLHAVARVVEAFVIVAEAKADLDVGFDLAWEIAEKYGLAKCVFVNKLERDNADYDGLINTLDTRYGSRVVNVQVPIGTRADFSGIVDLLQMKVYKGKDRGYEVEDIPEELKTSIDERREKMMDAAAEGDDELMLKYLDGEALSPEEVERGLHKGITSGKVVPVLLGSAGTGIGVKTLMDRIIGELPAPNEKPKIFGDLTLECDPNGSAVAECFKTTADPFVGKINYLRVFRGKIKQDDHLQNINQDEDERLHNLFIPHGKEQETAIEVVAGDICGVAKLSNTHTGDTLAPKGESVKIPPIDTPEPVYRIAIKPVGKSDEDKMGAALEKLLEEDPTLRYTRDDSLHQEILEGMGDIHLLTTIEKLRERFGVSVETEEAKVPYRETVTGTAEAQGKFKRQTGGRGQYGDCWLRISPQPQGSGFEFVTEIVGGSIPKNYLPAVEKGVMETMQKGFLAGFPVEDVKVVCYDGSYHDVDSSEAAFKQAGKIAFKAAATKANPVLLEPILNVQVTVPDEFVGDAMGDLNGRRGQPQGTEPASPGKTSITAIVPMATMTRYALDLRSITKGAGLFSAQLSHYQPVPHDEMEKIIAKYKKEDEDDD